MKYIALVHQAAGQYGVSFPDFFGCIATGSSADDALADARQALAFHVEGMREDGETIPAPRTIDAIRADPDLTEMLACATLAYVHLIEDLGHPKRVNLSLDAGLLTAIDHEASRRRVTRSAFLSAAARRELEG